MKRRIMVLVLMLTLVIVSTVDAMRDQWAQADWFGIFAVLNFLLWTGGENPR